MSNDRWYKEDESNQIWWLDNSEDTVGVFIFSFDKKTTFNLFADYPYKLTKEQKTIFDKEEPEWAEFFKERNNG
jgi:hypothetical protein